MSEVKGSSTAMSLIDEIPVPLLYAQVDVEDRGIQIRVLDRFERALHGSSRPDDYGTPSGNFARYTLLGYNPRANQPSRRNHERRTSLASGCALRAR
jgi:hypothetical protein